MQIFDANDVLGPAGNKCTTPDHILTFLTCTKRLIKLLILTARLQIWEEALPHHSNPTGHSIFYYLIIYSILYNILWSFIY